MAGHLRGRWQPRARHWAGGLGVVGVLVLAFVAGCGPAATQTSWIDGAPKPGAQLSFSLDDQAAGVSPTANIAVQVTDGTLDSVTLTAADGSAVQGQFDEAHLGWRAVDPLQEGTTYTIAANSTGIDGKPVDQTRSFSTVTPDNHVSVRFAKYWSEPIQDGETFGVGQPIIAWFDEAIPDKKAAEAAIQVTTNPPTTGAWYWYSDREAHWRPKDYWAAGTTVTVTSHLYGAYLGTQSSGKTLYGDPTNAGNPSTVSFTIGASHIASIDNNTKQMTIYFDGQQLTNLPSLIPNNTGYGYYFKNGQPTDTIPVSLGLDHGYTSDTGVWIDTHTFSGIMTVMDKGDPVLMKPAGVAKTDSHYYEEKIPKAVRFTSDGEYVHWADWSIYDQGYYNQSHGCVNIHPAYATWFYNTFITGDVIQIANTGENVPSQDGNTDWNVSWDDWLAGGPAFA